MLLVLQFTSLNNSYYRKNLPAGKVFLLHNSHEKSGPWETGAAIYPIYGLTATMKHKVGKGDVYENL